MANVYFGDGVSTNTGAWNTVGNWYSSVGSYNCCCGSANITPGTPLGRLPNAASDTVYLVSQGDGSSTYGQTINLTSGPTGTYSGAILALQSGGPNGTGCNVVISAGTYGGTITLGAGLQLATGATFTGTVNFLGNSTSVDNGQKGGTISGGTFSGTVNLKATSVYITASNTSGATANIPFPYDVISGGTFTGTVNRINPLNPVTVPNGSGGYPWFGNAITGGTYSPTATVTFNTSTGKFTGFPADPGFSLGGGTFSPTITISNLPSGGTSILGAGFP